MNLSANDAYGVLTAADSVRIERVLPGPIERVWAYLTESDKRRHWLAAGEMDLRVGGAVELNFDNARLTRNDDPPPAKYASDCVNTMRGRITAIEPPHLLRYTWNEDSGSKSEVSFELSAQDDQVLLVVHHRHLSNRAGLVGVSGGWHAHLGLLIDVLSQREPEGFWRSHKRLDAEYEQRIPQA
ncbi:SRPBCC family protein [Lysobacter enzymogenes]|uniref:SRPBCC family protein n=1 Tax=Lysobacter enzymogenes TaxID=69 RepID=A0A3N2RGS4_LYSEN|nr:SRPBCC family protein [Lysobacter enzymogenes]ROU06628.1 SRPBCC family protein [Lysobacter enzymogenes]